MVTTIVETDIDYDLLNVGVHFLIFHPVYKVVCFHAWDTQLLHEAEFRSKPSGVYVTDDGISDDQLTGS